MKRGFEKIAVRITEYSGLANKSLKVLVRS